MLTAASGLALTAALATAGPAHAATVPSVPTDLFNATQACSADASSPDFVWVGTGGPLGNFKVEGMSQDANTSDAEISMQFQVWPVSDPTQITTVSDSFDIPGDEGYAEVPTTDLTDGQTYAWQADATGSDGTSAWSAPCYFTVDNDAPSSPPTVTSPNYPQGQVNQAGTPIQFTLGANGVSDVAGYVFSFQGTLPVAITSQSGAGGIPEAVDPYADTANFARATTVGGSATVSLVPPAGFGNGTVTFTVASLDRAYNISSETTYTIETTQTAPTITPVTSSPQFDRPMRFQLQPAPGLQAASPVVSYTVKYTDDSVHTLTVKAARNGTAKLKVVLDGISSDVVEVTSTSADGWVSGVNTWDWAVDTTPTVSSDVYLENQTSGGVGVPGTFTFAPKVKHIVSYTYSINGGPETTVKANAKGVATITWTPDESGFGDLDVYGTTRNGIQLSDYDYFFNVS